MNDAERFEQIFLSQVTRPGADKLLEWLKSTDFFTAPASTRFHGAYPGGLVKHSLNVYYALLGNFNLRGLYSPQTQTIVALLHDVCKANYYAGEYPDYTVKDQIPMGHGEKSVYRHIYGVVWDGTSTTVWSRTDEAASFVNPTPYRAGATNYTSASNSNANIGCRVLLWTGYPPPHPATQKPTPGRGHPRHPLVQISHQDTV